MRQADKITIWEQRSVVDDPPKSRTMHWIEAVEPRLKLFHNMYHRDRSESVDFYVMNER